MSSRCVVGSPRKEPVLRIHYPIHRGAGPGAGQRPAAALTYRGWFRPFRRDPCCRTQGRAKPNTTPDRGLDLVPRPDRPHPRVDEEVRVERQTSDPAHRSVWLPGLPGQTRAGGRPRPAARRPEGHRCAGTARAGRRRGGPGRSRPEEVRAGVPGDRRGDPPRLQPPGRRALGSRSPADRAVRWRIRQRPNGAARLPERVRRRRPAGGDGELEPCGRLVRAHPGPRQDAGDRHARGPETGSPGAVASDGGEGEAGRERAHHRRGRGGQVPPGEPDASPPG